MVFISNFLFSMLIYLLLHLIIKGDIKITLEGQQTQHKESSPYCFPSSLTSLG